MQDIQQARAQQEAVEREAAEAKAILEFYLENPQWSLTANTNILREFHHGEPVTLQSLRESVVFLKDLLAVKGADRLQAEHEGERAALEAEYESLLPVNTDKPLRDEIMSRVKYKSDAELAQLIENRKAEIELRKHTAQEIRTSLVPDRTPKFPELPAEMTASTIKKLHPHKLRSLLRVYGDSQVNSRLAGR